MDISKFCREKEVTRKKVTVKWKKSTGVLETTNLENYTSVTSGDSNGYYMYLSFDFYWSGVYQLFNSQGCSTFYIDTLLGTEYIYQTYRVGRSISPDGRTSKKHTILLHITHELSCITLLSLIICKDTVPQAICQYIYMFCPTPLRNSCRFRHPAQA